MVTPETWGYLPFKKLLERDETEFKENALNDMLFINHFADIGSDYEFIRDEDERVEAIRKDIGLAKDWKVDSLVQDAIDFYKDRSETAITRLYFASLNSANDISDYLNETKALLNERDRGGKPVYTLSSITGALKNVKIIMKDLKEAYKEVIKEAKDMENKSIGSQVFNTFEGGLGYSKNEE